MGAGRKRSCGRCGPVLAVVGVLGVVVASFLPWGRSGGATRTSYELIDAAGSLEVVSGAGAIGAQAWYLVPLLVAGTWLAAVRCRCLLMAGLSAFVGSMAGVLAVAVKLSPVGADIGTNVALAAGVIALVGSAWSAWEHRRQA